MKAALFLLLTALTVQAQFGFRNSYDAEAQDWAKVRVASNGGTISGSSYVAGTRLVLFFKSRGVRSHICRMNVYLGNATNAVVVPLINKFVGGSVLGNTTDTFIAFGAADYSEATGLTGDGVSKYLGTGLAASSSGTAGSFHVAVYNRSNAYGTDGSIGSSTAGGYVGYLQEAYTGGVCYIYFDDAGSIINGTDGSPPTGLYVATRTSQTSRVVYKNGSVLFSSSTDLGTTPAINGEAIVVHAVNASGTVNSWTAKNLCFYAVGNGITADIQLAYYLGVQRLQYDLNRQKP